MNNDQFNTFGSANKMGEANQIDSSAFAPAAASTIR
tara:strand:+ start:238 stop:345 length:108 start_codon:yes stop_codon:yes gene_type:complete